MENTLGIQFSIFDVLYKSSFKILKESKDENLK